LVCHGFYYIFAVRLRLAFGFEKKSEAGDYGVNTFSNACEKLTAELRYRRFVAIAVVVPRLQ